MGLIYRTSSLANVGASSIKNAELTYEEGDGNIAFLLTNLSGSNVSIQGNATLSGPVQLNGTLQADGIVYVPNLTSASQNYTVTYDTGSGRLYYTASSAIVSTRALFADTASFVTASNVYGPFGSNSIISSSVATTASFVTASNVYGPYGANSVLSSSFAISASWAPFVATNTGSLLVTASVASNTITFTKGDGSTFPISVDTGSAVTTPTASLLVTASATNNVITFIKGNGDQFNITVNTGSVDLSGYTTTSSFNAFTSSYNTGSFSGSFVGSFNGTASWANNAQTASFVTASNVYGPHGSSSVLSSSFAVSASWAPSTSTNTGSLLTTASVSNNTITFTKGDGSTFPITVNTGSGGGVSGGTQYYLPVWTGASTLGTSSLYESASVLKSVYGGSDIGLKLDFANQTHFLGDFNGIGNQTYFATDPGTALSYIYTDGYRNLYFTGPGSSLGDTLANFNATIFLIDDALQYIKTSYQGSDIGLKLDFANNNYTLGTPNIKYQIDDLGILGGNANLYFNTAATDNGIGISVVDTTTATLNYVWLGDYNNTGNGTSLRIDDLAGSSNIRTRYQSNDIGLKLDFSSSKYELGQLTGGNQTKLTINDATQTIALTGSLQVTGSTYLRGLTSSSQTSVLTYNSSTGQVFFTASSAIGGGGSGTPAPSDTFIQYNSGSTFGADASFRFIYTSQSLQQGSSVIASGQYSHAEGSSTQAIGVASHAEGQLTTAIGFYSHAEGSETQAIGDISHAEGQYAIAIGLGSHAEGESTIASGSYSHAEGYTTQARGNGSHAEGQNTIALGDHSHAEGAVTQAIGNWSHAEGQDTVAIGDYSHAEGIGTQAIGTGSHAEGIRTVTSASYQHAQGIANIGSAVTGAFIVGNGTVDNGGNVLTRSNLIFAAGNTVEITGSLLISGSTNAAQISNGWVVLSQVSASLNFANDAAAAAGGVPLGGLYRNGNAISIRIV
jgi:hypothetical protein